MFCIARFWHVLLLIAFTSAFDLFPPAETAPFATVTIFYKRHSDDPQSWTLDISNIDGSNATVLRERFFTPEKHGNFTEKIPLSGMLILRAVNPDDFSQVYATSKQFVSIDAGAVDSGGSAGTDPGGSNGSNADGPPTANATPTDSSSLSTSLTTSVDSQPSLSTSSTTSPQSSLSKSKSPNMATIIGAAVAGVVTLLIVVAVLIFVFRRKRRQRPTTFYRDRMVRPPATTSQATSPSASSFAGLVPPSRSYQRMREKDEGSSIASLGPGLPYSKR